MHHIVIPILTLGVYALRRAVKKLPAKALPWVSAVLGVLCAVLTGDANAHSAVEGAVEGLAASGLWGAVGKHLVPIQSAQPPAGPAQPVSGPG